uniref:Uncharacterized protein n=1 Tax=Ananas comosus var. bracteatus TaxID=296719 RepID=A0A6V7NP59_ANACO|nr:unnamed protein product [Ananas comosus var. bracteatus]
MFQAHRKTIHPFAVPFPSSSVDTAAPSVSREESEETPDPNSDVPPASSVPIPSSSSVPALEKRSMKPKQSIPPPPLKRRKSVAKKSHSKRVEGISSADVLEKRAEDTPSADVPEKRAEETPSADISDQASVPNEPITIEINRQLRREARLEKKREAEKKWAAQEMSKEVPTSDVAPPLSTPTTTTERENIGTPLEEGIKEASAITHSTPEASVPEIEDPLSATLHALLISSPNSNEGDDSSTVVMSTDTQQKFDECLRLYSHENQESALQQRISTLKEELAAIESTLARTSERRLLLQDQLKIKKSEGMKLQDKLSQLYKVHPLMKRRRKAVETAQANLIAEWNQLKDLLS